MTLKKFDEIKDANQQRYDFINWLNKETSFKKSDKSDDTRWVDDSDCYYNILEINLDNVIYHWEEIDNEVRSYNTKKFTFEEFKDAYNKSLLK